MNKIRLIFLASFLASFSYGIMLLLPLYISNIGYSVLVSGKVISSGIFGVVLTMLILPVIIRL